MAFGLDDALMVAAGAQVVGGLLGSDASKSAANTQAKAGEASIAEQAREFDASKKALAPYRALGEQGAYTLAGAMGMSGQPIPQNLFDAQAYLAANPDVAADPGYATNPYQHYLDHGIQEVGAGKRQLGFNAPNASGVTPGALTKPFNFDVTQDPGYQFRLGEGTKAMENSAAARGSQLSGATLKELMKYGSDYASGEFNAAFSRDQSTKAQLYGMLTGTTGIGSGATNTQVGAGTATAGNIGNTMQGIGNVQAAGTVGSANALGGALGNIGNSAVNAMTLRSVLNPQNPIQPILGGVNLDSAGSNDLLRMTG